MYDSQKPNIQTTIPSVGQNYTIPSGGQNYTNPSVVLNNQTLVKGDTYQYQYPESNKIAFESRLPTSTLKKLKN